MCNELSNQWLAEDIEMFLVDADDTTLSAYNSQLEYLANHETVIGEEQFYKVNLSDPASRVLPHRTFNELVDEYKLWKQDVASERNQLEWQIVLEGYALELKERTRNNPWLKLRLPLELL